MTTNNENAIEILIKFTEDIQEEIGSGCSYCDEKRSVNCISSCWVSDVNVALNSLPKVKETLQKAKKYKWHDLRENPEDLPKGNKKDLVDVVYCDGISNVDTICNVRDAVLFSGKIYIAWKYREPFESEAKK